jgi:curved DNA-binding protein CbpA
VLGLKLPCRLDDVKTAYRRLAKTAHPDAGGNAKDFIAIEGAYREALAYCQRYGSHLAS